MVDKSFLAKNGLAIAGSNTFLSGNTLQVSNSTSTTTVTPATISTGIFTVNASGIFMGSNVVANATSIILTNGSANVLITPDYIQFANSTAAIFANSGGLSSTNATLNTVNGTLLLGANVTLNRSQLTIGANVVINATSISVGAAVINSTTFSGISLSANNTSYFNGQSASYYYPAASISSASVAYASVAANAVSANNANFFNGQPASYYYPAASIGGASVTFALSANNTSYFNGQSASYYYTAASIGSASVAYATNANSALFANSATYATYLAGQLGSYYYPAASISSASVAYASSSGLAAKASAVSQAGGSGYAMTFYYSDPGGVPSYVWGSTDGSNMYVYSPTRFSVNYATSAGSASSATNSNNSTYLNGHPDTYFATAGSIAGASVNYASSSGLAAKASTLSQGGGNGSGMIFYYLGQSGQPSYLWGTSDGINTYVYNPSNFSVNYATSASSATYATYLGGQSSSYYTNAGNLTGTLPSAVFGTGTNYQGYVVSAGSYLYSYGNVYAVGDVYSSWSDKRLKRDLNPIYGALSIIEQLTGYTYYQNELGASLGYKTEGRQLGLIAQEVQQVLPEVIGLAAFDMTEDGTSQSGENYLTINYARMVPVLLQAIKELKQQVDELKGH